MNINSLNSCSGCGACAYTCPKDAITIYLNNDGYYEHRIDNEKCVDCGRCLKVCSHNSSETNKRKKDITIISETKTYKARAVKEIANKSSSGGIAYLLMQKGIVSGKKVVGVRYDNQSNKAVFDIAADLTSIEKFRGSKYIQANPAVLISGIKDYSKKYVFIGCPCQVYGFSRALEIENRKEDFLFVDFFCHGVPSYLIWDKMVQELIGNNAVEHMTFRDKTHGYHKFHLCFNTTDGQIITSEERKENKFYQLFDSGYLMSTGCYDCPFRYTHSAADIRIGDFWDNKCGNYYSRVAVCTERGKNALKEIEQYLEIEPAQIRLSRNAIIKTELEAVRNKLLNSLKTVDSLEETVGIYFKILPLKEKLKMHAKTVLGKIK